MTDSKLVKPSQHTAKDVPFGLKGRIQAQPGLTADKVPACNSPKPTRTLLKEKPHLV